MTLANCERLLKHYEDLVNGVIVAPVGHKNWDLVIANAKINAAEMKARIERKKKLPKYAVSKPVEVKDGKKSTG